MDAGSIFMAVQWIYTLLAFLLVLNRLCVRTFRRPQFFSHTVACWSDMLVVVAWVFYLLLGICNTMSFVFGGLRTDLVTGPKRPGDMAKFVKVLKVDLIIDAIYFIPIYCIKGAILTFFLEVTTAGIWWVRRAAWLGLIMSALGILATTLLDLAACPLSQIWDLLFVGGSICHIGVLIRILIIALYFHILNDIYIYIILFFIIRRLNITTRAQKFAAAGMFLVGFVEICLAVAQLYESWNPTDLNPMWPNWFALHEQTLAIVIACLPKLRVSAIGLGNYVRSGKRGKSISVTHRLRRGELTTKEVVSINTAFTSHGIGQNSNAGRPSLIDWIERATQSDSSC